MPAGSAAVFASAPLNEVGAAFGDAEEVIAAGEDREGKAAATAHEVDDAEDAAIEEAVFSELRVVAIDADCSRDMTLCSKAEDDANDDDDEDPARSIPESVREALPLVLLLLVLEDWAARDSAARTTFSAASASSFFCLSRCEKKQ